MSQLGMGSSLPLSAIMLLEHRSPCSSGALDLVVDTNILPSAQELSRMNEQGLPLIEERWGLVCGFPYNFAVQTDLLLKYFRCRLALLGHVGRARHVLLQQQQFCFERTICQARVRSLFLPWWCVFMSGIDRTDRLTNGNTSGVIDRLCLHASCCRSRTEGRSLLALLAKSKRHTHHSS